MVNVGTDEKVGTRPNLSALATVSFLSSFAVARVFTFFFPSVVLVGGGFHIHHFWYGLAMIAIGGWLGISYRNERIDRLAALLFGAGGGLVGDEIGLLITFGDYWAEITYTFMIIFLAFTLIVALLHRYYETITREFSQFLRNNASLYVGVFLAAVSIAFILETDNAAIITASAVLTVTACILILAYFIQRIIKRRARVP